MSDNSKKTPYYLIDIKKIKDNYISFKNSIDAAGREDIIAYSVKANYNPVIISILNELGAFFEVCSDYEYNLIISQGINPAHIIVNGCFFENYDKYKGSILIIDTLEQLMKWKNDGCNEIIGIRINMDHITVDERFRNKQSRFGIKVFGKREKELLKGIDVNKIICLHCHLSGNNREPSIYKDVVKELNRIRYIFNLNSLKYLDIGGGFKTGSNNSFWSFSKYVNEVCNVCGKEIQIIYEPGNSLVRNCAEYHTKVIAVKKINDKNIVVIDGSSLHIPKNYLKNLEYHIENNSKKSRVQGGIIYGNTCKESDLLLELSDEDMITTGDGLVVENIGAYSINEVRTIILGMPNIYIKSCDQLFFGDLSFDYVCRYKDCINENGSNNYSVINKIAKEKGLYIFVLEGRIIYIGVAYDRGINKRVTQHFRNDSGGLRKKLNNKQINILEKSYLYICKMNVPKQEMLYKEALIIGQYKPMFNYL